MKWNNWYGPMKDVSPENLQQQNNMKSQPNIQNSNERIKKTIVMLLLGVLVWSLAGLALSYVAYGYVGFLAASVTDSCRFPGSFSCRLFEWDSALQTAVYLSYLLAFIGLLFGCFYMLERAQSKPIKRLAVLVFIASFPTYTLWEVASNCAGFGSCSTGHHVAVVAPLIITFHPLSLISLVISMALVWLFLKKRNITV